MLYISKWKAAAILLTAFIVCLFAVPNFFAESTVKRWPAWAQRHVVLGLDLWATAELGVERAQQRVLATGGRREVGCAVDDLVVGDEHAATVCEPADTKFAEGAPQPGVLPISSTPLPFHRNFTTLSRPSMPPE